MDSKETLVIEGGQPLNGAIPISGAKNAALPLMCASLLTDKALKVRRVPLELADICLMRRLLEELGVEISLIAPDSLHLQLNALKTTEAPYEMVQKMRASVLILGPLLGRHGRARVSLPGGCAIGKRPIDLHLLALEQMGATISLEGGYVNAEARGGLKGCEITFPIVSVGATENVMMAACLAQGKTMIHNAAQEPEVVDLGHCLQAMGAQISGLGTSKICIEGVLELKGADHSNIQDRLEAGSMLCAIAATRGVGTVLYHDDLLGSLISKFAQAGLDVERREDGYHLDARNGAFQATRIETEPYPGFPTDLQAQWMAFMCTVRGVSHIHEAIFENRFGHIPELRRLGGLITVDGRHAQIKGGHPLSGADIRATDIRASMGLIIAALSAKGITRISQLHHLDRGFERVENKLSACKARIERVEDLGDVKRKIA